MSKTNIRANLLADTQTKYIELLTLQDDNKLFVRTPTFSEIITMDFQGEGKDGNAFIDMAIKLIHKVNDDPHTKGKTPYVPLFTPGDFDTLKNARSGSGVGSVLILFSAWLYNVRDNSFKVSPAEKKT